MGELNERETAAKKVTFFGMFINFLLVIFKFVSGILGNSAALIADAIHSLSDFVTDIVVIIGFRFTSKPADDKHNYGHGKVETVTTVIIGLLLILISFILMKSSGTEIYNYYFKGVEIVVPKTFVLIAVVLSIGLKEMLYQVTKVVGKRIKSDAIIANAWHHRSDALSSVAAFIGIVLAISFGKSFAVCDPIASFVVSLFVLKVGIDILLSSYSQLIDISISMEDVQKIEAIIHNNEDIRGFHKLKTRRIGYYNSIDVHILVDKNLNVEEAHAIATRLETNIYETFGKETFISVHVEPFYENYPEKN